MGVCVWLSYVYFVYVRMTHWILFALENIVQMTLRNVYKVKMLGCEGKSMGKLGYFIPPKQLTDRPKWMNAMNATNGSAKMFFICTICRRHISTPFWYRRKAHRRPFHTCHVIDLLQLEFPGKECHDTIQYNIHTMHWEVGVSKGRKWFAVVEMDESQIS